MKPTGNYLCNLPFLVFPGAFPPWWLDYPAMTHAFKNPFPDSSVNCSLIQDKINLTQAFISFFYIFLSSSIFCHSLTLINLPISLKLKGHFMEGKRIEIDPDWIYRECVECGWFYPLMIEKNLILGHLLISFFSLIPLECQVLLSSDSVSF